MNELPNRKQNRIPDFDYNTPNAYFITVCTQNKKKLFWENVGAVIGRPEDVQLSAYGKIVEKAIINISAHYPVVSVDKFVVMPNHIHILLQIHSDENGRPMTAPTISMVVNQMKGAVTKQIGAPIWQKGFYDHVIRNQQDYLEIWNYIEGNPAKWAEGGEEDVFINR